MIISRKSIVVIVLVVLASAYCGFWFYARTVAVQVIESWTEQRRADDYKVTYDGPEISGFPFLIRVFLKNPHLQKDSIAWRGERMKVELQPWNLRRIRVDLEGNQKISLKAGAAQVTLAAAEAAVVATLSEAGRLADATLLVRDLNLSNNDGTSLLKVAEIWMKSTAPPISTAPHKDTSLTLSLSSADIQLPQGADGPLGRTMAKLRADLQVRGNMPDLVLRESLESWRRSGGAVDVDRFQVNWGEFELRAKGTLALDAEARPLGAFTTDIRGYNLALDALVAHAVLEPGTATMAKFGMALLAKAPPEGGAPVLSLPVTAQEGHLYAGPLKILDLYPIRLPANR